MTENTMNVHTGALVRVAELATRYTKNDQAFVATVEVFGVNVRGADFSRSGDTCEVVKAIRWTALVGGAALPIIERTFELAKTELDLAVKRESTHVV